MFFTWYCALFTFLNKRFYSGSVPLKYKSYLRAGGGGLSPVLPSSAVRPCMPVAAVSVCTRRAKIKINIRRYERVTCPWRLCWYVDYAKPRRGKKLKSAVRNVVYDVRATSAWNRISQNELFTRTSGRWQRIKRRLTSSGLYARVL